MKKVLQKIEGWVQDFLTEQWAKVHIKNAVHYLYVNPGQTLFLMTTSPELFEIFEDVASDEFIIDRINEHGSTISILLVEDLTDENTTIAVRYIN